MKRTDEEKFERATDRLLAQQGGFIFAVQRIVAPATESERRDDAKRRLERINAQRKVSEIEAFCAAS